MISLDTLQPEIIHRIAQYLLPSRPKSSSTNSNQLRFDDSIFQNDRKFILSHFLAFSSLNHRFRKVVFDTSLSGCPPLTIPKYNKFLKLLPLSTRKSIKMVKLQEESLNVPVGFRTKTEMSDWFIKSLYESFRLLPNVTEFQVTTKTYHLSECPRWFRFLPTPSNSHQFPAIEETFDRDLNVTFPPVIHSTNIGSDITAYSGNVLDRFGFKLHSSHCKCSTICNQQRLVKCFALGCDEKINGCWDCATKFDPYRPFTHVVCSKHIISADLVDSRCGRCFVEMAVLTCGQSNHALRPTPWYCHDCAKDMLRTCDYCKDSQICHYCDVEGSGWDRWGDYSVCPTCKNHQQIA